MNIVMVWLLGAALTAFSTEPRYSSNCAAVDANFVEGYVTNQGRDALQVVGEVRFVFSSDDSMSRPAIAYAADSVIPAGQTVRIARVPLSFQPLPGETCRFEVKDAIRGGARSGA